MKQEADQLLALVRPGWPTAFTKEPNLRGALDDLVEDLEAGRPTSIPVARGDKVWWISVAQTVRELRMYVDDVRTWLTREDSEALAADVTTASPSSSSYSAPLAVLSPEGYQRWVTSSARAVDVVARLGRMHRFLATKPELAFERAPSLPYLRFEFIAALRVGDWDKAEACIDEIDHWNLDHAASTMQMRIRLLDAHGDGSELFDFVTRAQAWNFSNPRRIAGAIIRAVDLQAIEPVVVREGMEAALELFRTAWYPKLVQTIADARGDPTAARPLAYAASIDSDRDTLVELLPTLAPELGSFLLSRLPSPRDASSGSLPVVAARDEVGANKLLEATQLAFWTELHASVREGRTTRARELIASVDSQLLDDPLFISAAPDALLELLSDPTIESVPGPRLLQQEALVGLIDAFVVAPGFPRIEHLDIYLSLLEGLVALRGGTASEADSQLVLGLAGAAAHLSAAACPRCEQIIKAWWERRPVVTRLGWLLAALDSLASLHPEPHDLAGLFVEGLALAARKGRLLTQGEAVLWRTVGRRLELSAEEVELFVGPVISPPGVTPPDPLAAAGLRTIAIVSLRESSAREAAEALQARTGAAVSTLSSLVAGQDTRHAASADLILYVWAATTHATYRAFDGCRDRLEYVQGTGASSIVLAAERWATRQVAA